MSFLKKLVEPRILKRIFLERLTEPLHLNFLSLFIALFGTFRQRVAYDLILRNSNAFAILNAADIAHSYDVKQLAIIEFGVAAGAGLMNMCHIAEQVTQLTGVKIRVFGFDTGSGMPPAKDYRDHPDVYRTGDFPMEYDKLKGKLPSNGKLILGELAATIPNFLNEEVSSEMPIGYVVVDVDYYSSTVDALRLFEGDPDLYLPMTPIHLDDIEFDQHNAYAGELLAVSEFNERNKYRKICRPYFLENKRIFRRANWIKHIFYLQVMDHPQRFNPIHMIERKVLSNPYI